MDSGAHDTPTPSPEPAPVVTSRLWHGLFGDMLIETRADGSVWVNGEPVRDTLPPEAGRGASALD